ncbi:MAG: hypothetical protein E6J90_11520 [Deltaproteobacteria bacterium]|nr:MAG: hypothetical protein E6J91_04010 [Deltaproteobacteria bacterium]TMQ22997.1 MAG: hypothetical protein E6J90_11520 [Deltaproteobacteria bacterium]
MLKTLRRKVLRVLSKLFSDRMAERLARRLSRRFVDQLRDRATDEFLEILLRSMDIAFALSGTYRKNNLDKFHARYVFATRDGKVGATADFADGDMKVSDEAKDDFTVRIRFKDAAALRRFLFAEKQDVLTSVLDNEVEIDGNVNYVYKLGYMANDLERRLGMAA